MGISGTIFEGNSAFDKGGAIYIDNEDMSLVNAVFRNNHATFGGALCFMNRSKTLFGRKSFIFSCRSQLL